MLELKTCPCGWPQARGWEPRPVGGNPDPWVGTQTHGWEPRPVGGNPDPWVGTQTHGWEPRPMGGNPAPMGGNPDPWVGTQARGWEPRPMGGNPDPWVGTQARGWEIPFPPFSDHPKPFPTRLQIPVGHIMMPFQTGSKHCIHCATCHKKRPQVTQTHGWEPRPVGGNPGPPRPVGGNPDPWVGNPFPTLQRSPKPLSHPSSNTRGTHHDAFSNRL